MIYATQAGAVETRRIIGKLEQSQKVGTHVGGGRHVNMPATWDGKGAPAPGWTCHDVKVVTKDSTHWACEITAQVITDSADSTHRARCTAAELVVLDAAVAGAAVLDSTWNSASRVSDVLLRVYSVLGSGQSNAVGQFNGTNSPALLTALSSGNGALVIFTSWAVGGTPVTDALRGGWGDASNYSAGLTSQIPTVDAVPLSVPVHFCWNQGEYEASGNTSTGPNGTVDFSNWATAWNSVAADVLAQMTSGRFLVCHIFLLNQSQSFSPSDHKVDVRAQQVSAAAGYTDAHGGFAVTYNMDSIPPDNPPHWVDANYQVMNGLLGASIVSNQG